MNNSTNETKVLVVDDEPVVCRSVKKILSKYENFRIDEALDAKSALDKIEHDRYGIIFADMIMPEVGGMDLLKIVKEKHPEISFVMITGYATIKTAVQSIKFGALDYLPKPFTPDELKFVADRALKNYRNYVKEHTYDSIELTSEADAHYAI